MAYASIAQADHDAFAGDSPLNSPAIPGRPSPPLSLPDDALSEAGDQSTRSQAGTHAAGVGSLLKSISSTPSYEMVEGDDYEEPMPTPRGLGLKMEDPAAQHEDTITFQSEEPPMRTASISRHLPLNHPTPDLHALQGALVKNVERLEESAERLSMTSSLEDELNKMRQDQKRLERQSSAPASLDNVLRPPLQRQFSAGSWSNSIIGLNHAARTGGYSPSGYITSPTGSIRSGLWSHQQQLERHSSKGSDREHALPGPPLEGRPLDLTSNRHATSSIHLQQGAATASRESPGDAVQDSRPATAASNDTYRQELSAFDDFDGVHYGSGVSHEPAGSKSRQIPLKHPPLARDSRAYKEAQPGEQMIYYPAPVPVMLNLPQRLSKANLSEREKRRIQALSGISHDMRNSAAWLADMNGANTQGPRSSLNLPSHLRASAFFEYPSVTEDLQLKNGSAVQTLDSILDAAAYAPVSAFTDHPIAGQVGKEVYGRSDSPRKSTQLSGDKAKKRRSSLSTLLKTRRSSAGLSETGLHRRKSRDSKALGGGDEYASGDELDQAAAESIAPDADEFGGTDDNEDAEAAVPSGFSAAPTTLLAELQMRKEQQRQRNRTAADAFPRGMHSTLLELDAVTQLQQKARKTKHVTLAWEDHEEADKQNFDDEDTPLGLLFPEKDRANHVNVNRPIGLIERREMEDNEPLSQRRARLRGEPLQSLKSETRSQADEATRAPFIDDVPGLSEAALPENEGETLAQRAARLKLEKEKDAGGQFAEEVASQLGLQVEPHAPQSKTPDGEETLAQRRKRLKDEAARRGAQPDGRKQVRSVHSLADILQAHPVGVRSREVSNESKTPQRLNAQPQGPFLQVNPSFPPVNSYQSHPFPHASNWGSALANGVYGNAYMNGAINGAQPPLYGTPIPMHMQQPMAFYPYGYGNQPYMQDPMMGPPLDPKQRAQIDLWRQSIGE
ncbi:hypothetical protein A1O3_10043 [Capronia epimyces CBS 606.96]|uniref:Uncharacterized protein n=1 Tax=Capronia epimyces CBS 606.96 TaxID=1182542 RepID=W9XIW7_9EURO|nr:uncharacterized protein A1O3_10043 [Capronia epimyces CBS 606.96]EXJ76886.1 hypothetical protein A1O3_10043 [Capronia epimyces CBS 606.96]